MRGKQPWIPTEAQRALVDNMWRSFYSLDLIAAATGVSYSVLCRYSHRMRFEKRPGQLVRAVSNGVESLRKSMDDGESRVDLSIPPSALKDWPFGSRFDRPWRMMTRRDRHMEAILDRNRPQVPPTRTTAGDSSAMCAS